MKKASSMQPRYPEISVKLFGEDGNAFAILGRCQQAATQAGLPKSEIAMQLDLTHEATRALLKPAAAAVRHRLTSV